MSEIYKKIPNWLTYSRLGLIPVFVLLMVDPSAWMVHLATLVFILAALTDLFDGYLARRYQAVSDFGKLLDPVADKILVMTALVMLTSLRSDVYGEPWVPGWMVVLVLAREIWISGLRAVAASRGKIVAASVTGKYKSGFQMFAIVLLLLHELPLTLLGFEFTAQMLGVNLLLLSVLVSYWGAYEYTTEILSEQQTTQGSLNPQQAQKDSTSISG